MWDVSGSAEVAYESSLLFLNQIVYGLDFAEQRMALATYADDVVIRFDLDDYTDRIDYLSSLVFTGTGGQTNTQEALRVADETLFTEDRGDRPDEENILVLMTDGKGNINNDNTVGTAGKMKRDGTRIYVIALGEDPDPEINDVASSPPEKHIFQIIAEEDVDGAVREFLTTICNRL